jgi:hypothetical protein
MSTINFKTKLYTIGSWTILQLPESASSRLPSRAMNMVEGTVNGYHFQTVLEPDGKGSHWLLFDKTLQKATNAKAGDTVTVQLEPTKEWIEPELPMDLKKALASAPQAQKLWTAITPLAHWDWIRWIRATKVAETRKRHIEVAISKLRAGTRRPCCFNRNLCTEPFMTHNWKLLEPS